MQKNTFYILSGAAALVLVFLFYLSVELRMPWIIFIGILVAAVSYVVCRRTIASDIADERQMFIDMKTSSATLKASAVLFLAVNITMAVYAFSFPQMIIPHPHHPAPVTVALTSLGFFALVELVLLVVTLFMYVGFHIYYAKKYGGWEEDEE